MKADAVENYGRPSLTGPFCNPGLVLHGEGRTQCGILYGVVLQSGLHLQPALQLLFYGAGCRQMDDHCKQEKVTEKCSNRQDDAKLKKIFWPMAQFNFHLSWSDSV